MKRMLTLLAISLVSFGAPNTLAREERTIQVTQLTDNLYRLTATYPFETNMVVSSGEDGLLLVDSGSRYTMGELKKVLSTIGNGQVRMIISTHAHSEHTAGNKAFGKEVVKIGHERVRARLKGGLYVLEEYPESALPNITVVDSLSLYFNGEKIRLIALPGAHDDNDIIVHFTESKVVCTGALSAGMHFPSVDGVGGNALRYATTVQKLIDLVPDDVVLVPGHGRNSTMTEQREFQNMLTKTTEIVKNGLASGKDVAALQEEEVLKGWAAFEGGTTTSDQWIRYIANAVQNKKPKNPAAVELYYALKEGGADSAVSAWHQLKKNRPDQYSFSEAQLVIFGYYLLEKDKIQDAIKIFQLYIDEFPESWNAYDSMGEAHMMNNDKEQARKYYRKSLELNPDNTNAEEMLRKLDNSQ
ncbi:MAG: MBL fold metallo-hydrolase [candidate division Zixibacteria bacterium]|nr:MBL fold metallo-hydrolase [candidate division Zixibacteria bacterium]